MKTIPDLSYLIAFGSLIVSIISLLYARKAFKFEAEKYAFEQTQKDIVIDFEHTIVGELKDNYVLLSRFSIVNKTEATAFIRYCTINLLFRVPDKPDKIFPNSTTGLFLDPNGGKSWGAAPHYFSEMISSMGGIETVVIDMNTNKRIFFNADDMIEIAPIPKSYVWKSITVVPKVLMDEMNNRRIKINGVELDFSFYPPKVKTVSSSKIYRVGRASSEVFNLEELSSIFPQYEFEEKSIYY